MADSAAKHDYLELFCRPGGDGRYGRHEVYAAGNQVKAGIFSDLMIDLAMAFGS